MDIIIEKVKSEDAAGLLNFLRQVGGETDNLTFGADGLPFTVEDEAAYIDSLENSLDSIMLVAKCNGEIVGNASLNRLPRRMSHRGDFSVAVAEAYWNCGIGGRLLKEILVFAKENAIEVIDLQVRSDNQSAIHLYEKFGFEKIGQHASFFKVRDQYIAFDYMCLTV